MPIVPNLNNSPISPVTPLVDPHNEGWKEIAYNNDIVHVDRSITSLTGGAQQILAANPLRRAVRIVNPNGNTDIAVGIVALTGFRSKGATTLFAGNGLDFKGRIAGNAFFVFGTAAEALTILVDQA